MAFARDVYTAGAAQTDYTITFPYQANADVKVFNNGSLLTVTTDYTFFSSTVIRLVVASTSGDTVVLQRSTSQATRDVVFVAGTLAKSDLNNAAIQAFYMAQEAIDIANIKLGKNTAEIWDAETLKILNVVDPTLAQDAATKNYVDGVALGTFPSPLAVGSGGTGSTTAAAARTALGVVIGTDVAAADADPITTRGDLVTGDATGDPQRLALGASGTFVKSDGTDAAYAALALADLPDGVAVQVVNSTDGALATFTSDILYDDSIPQITEGTEVLSVAITPKSTTNKLKIEVVIGMSSNIIGDIQMGLFQDSTANALAAASNGVQTLDVDKMFQISIIYFMTAGTTSATTFKVRIGDDNDGATMSFNGAASARKLGGVSSSSITVTEYKAS